jgi:hypothetical protein
MKSRFFVPSLVLAAADYMAKNLKHIGYDYIVIDMMWYGDSAASDYEGFIHETMPVKPNYTLDEWGTYTGEFSVPIKSHGTGLYKLSK